MKQVIRKFHLATIGNSAVGQQVVPNLGHITHPKGFHIISCAFRLTADMTFDLKAWGVGDPDQPLVTRDFELIQTGEMFDTLQMQHLRYHSTAHCGMGTACHIYLAATTKEITPPDEDTNPTGCEPVIETDHGDHP